MRQIGQPSSIQNEPATSQYMSQPATNESVGNGANTTELAELKAAHARLLDRQARIMELIGTTDANHLLHDLRNILNERELLRALANMQG